MRSPDHPPHIVIPGSAQPASFPSRARLRMSHLPFLGALCLLLVAACDGDCRAEAVPKGASLEETARFLSARCLELESAPAVVLGVALGDEQAVAAAGHIAVGGRAAEPVDTVLLASVTKTFTAALALKLAEEGRLSLDDTLDRFVDDVPNGDRITVRHLLNMTSGLFEPTGAPRAAVKALCGDVFSPVATTQRDGVLARRCPSPPRGEPCRR